MSQENRNVAFKILMKFYEAETIYLSSSGRDFSIIAETLDSDVVIYQPDSLPYGGEWRGHDGFRRWMEEFGRQWSHLEVKNSEFYMMDDVVCSRSHVYAVARETGAQVNWPLLQYFKVRNGKILELRPFHWDTHAMLPALRGAEPHK